MDQEGRLLASCLEEDVVLSDLRTGEELARIEGVSILLPVLQRSSDMLTS